MPHPRQQLGAHPRTGDNQPAWWCEGGPGHDICCIGLFKSAPAGPGTGSHARIRRTDKGMRK
jgi:hypothetical protein